MAFQGPDRSRWPPRFDQFGFPNLGGADGNAGETKLNHKDEQVQRFGNRMCRERVIFYGHILEVDIHNTRRHGAS